MEELRYDVVEWKEQAKASQGASIGGRPRPRIQVDEGMCLTRQEHEQTISCGGRNKQDGIYFCKPVQEESEKPRKDF